MAKCLLVSLFLKQLGIEKIEFDANSLWSYQVSACCGEVNNLWPALAHL